MTVLELTLGCYAIAVTSAFLVVSGRWLRTRMELEQAEGQVHYWRSAAWQLKNDSVALDRKLRAATRVTQPEKQN